jgi:hypothetical protein
MWDGDKAFATIWLAGAALLWASGHSITVVPGEWSKEIETVNSVTNETEITGIVPNKDEPWLQAWLWVLLFGYLFTGVSAFIFLVSKNCNCWPGNYDIPTPMCGIFSAWSFVFFGMTIASLADAANKSEDLSFSAYPSSVFLGAIGEVTAIIQGAFVLGTYGFKNGWFGNRPPQ